MMAAAALVGSIGTLLFVLETCLQLNVLILHSSSTSQSSAWLVDADNTSSSLLLPADNVSTAALWGQQEQERWRQVVVILLGVSLILSSALLTVISIVWVYTTMDFLGSKVSNCICIMLHVVQLGWLWRYIKLLLLNDSRDLQEFLLLRLVHASLQSAPFLIIQGFTAIVDTTVITHPVHLAALVISLLSLTVAYTSYQANTPQVAANSNRECIINKESLTGLDSEGADIHACKHNSQDILSYVILFFAKLLVLYARVTSFVMLVGVNVMWIILVLPLHSLVYSIIIFIMKYKSHEVLGVKNILLSAANLIDLICDKPLCEMLIFYVLVTVENIGVGLCFYLTSSWPYSLMLFATSLASMFLGTLLIMLHQGCFKEPNHDQSKSSIVSRCNIDEPLPIIEETMIHETPDSGINENNDQEEIHSTTQTYHAFETDENHNDVELKGEIEKLKEISQDTYICEKHKHPEHPTEALLDACWLAGRTSNDESGSGYFSGADITTICGSIRGQSFSSSSASFTSHLSPTNTTENSCKDYCDSGYFGDKTSSGAHSIHLQSSIQLNVNELPTYPSLAFSNRYPSLLDTTVTHPTQSVSSTQDASSSMTSSQSSLQLVHHQRHTRHWRSLPPARSRQHTLPDHQQGKPAHPAGPQYSYNHEHHIAKDSYKYTINSESNIGLKRSQTLGHLDLKYVRNNSQLRRTKYDNSLISGDDFVDIGYEEESSDWSSYCTTCDESDMYSSDSTMTWPPTVSRRNLSLLTAAADHDVPSQQLLHIHSWLHNVHSSLYHLTSASTPNLHIEDRVRGRREDRGCFTSSRLYHSVYVPKTSAKDKLLALCSGYKARMYSKSKQKVQNTVIQEPVKETSV